MTDRDKTITEPRALLTDDPSLHCVHGQVFTLNLSTENYQHVASSEQNVCIFLPICLSWNKEVNIQQTHEKWKSKVLHYLRDFINAVREEVGSGGEEDDSSSVCVSLSQLKHLITIITTAVISTAQHLTDVGEHKRPWWAHHILHNHAQHTKYIHKTSKIIYK